MKGIILKDSIKLFGFKDGFGFWFRWSFISPIEHFIWLNITHKEYCLQSGWYCRGDCNSRHLKTKEEVLAEFEKHKKEAETIIVGKKGECAYCGEEKGTEIIDDPNWNTLEKWKVCKTCKEVLEIQRKIPMLGLLPYNKETENKIFDLNNRLLEIEKITGKKIFSTTLQKNDDGSYSKIDT